MKERRDPNPAGHLGCRKGMEGNKEGRGGG